MSAAGDESTAGISTGQATEAIADNWENIVGDQVHQLTNERLSLAEQQQRTTVIEQEFMSQPSMQQEDIGLPPSMINKPIKLLKREPALRKRLSDSEGGDEAEHVGNSSLDARKANYDKIRERIFNAASVEEKDEALVLSTAKSEESIKKSETVDTDASTSNEIMIETINHLSNVQMLSEQTPHRRVPVMAPMHPPPWVPPPNIHLPFMPPDAIRPLGLYGGVPPHPPDFSIPPPSLPPYMNNQVNRNRFNP